MDGVLAIYDRDAYIWPDPKFMRLHDHYFLNVRPDKAMLHLFNTLCHNKKHNVFVLTSVSEPLEIRTEQVIDKIHWLEKHCPNIDIEKQFIIAASDKRNTINAIGQLSKDDILIDDFNRNLNHWNEVGGTAIKYCNGINTPESFSGLKIHNTMSYQEMLQILNIRGDIDDSEFL